MRTKDHLTFHRLNKIPHTLLTLFFLVVGMGVCGQGTADTLQLQEVEVTAQRRSHFAAGMKVIAVDSATLQRYRSTNLAELLGNESPLFIKSYGLGSLATTAFRGGSANHTAILWNGFNLGSPMNGMIDLSLIPMGFANSVVVQYGGSSALWGSGAVGGTVLLDNVVSFDRGSSVEAALSFGSFNDLRQQARVEISKARWVSAISVFRNAAKNDFSFYGPQALDAPLRRQRNAELQQHGLLSENHYRIDARQRINLRYWYQHSQRNIPPTAQQQTSSANQQDESHRVTAEWQRSGSKVTSHLRAAYFDEALNWQASSDGPLALSRSQNLITEGELRVRPRDGQLIDLGINNTFSRATSDGLKDRPQQHRAAVFTSYRLATQDRRLVSSVSFRQEWLEQRAVPYTFSLGSEFSLAKAITAKASFAKVYRIPTLNDLYWTPGGNPDLLSESGYSGELGLLANWAPSGKSRSFRSEITWFNRTMDNWIIWLPGATFWTPQNLMRVWSRGVETNTALSQRFGKTKVELGLQTNYVLSTNAMMKSANDASVDKQLIYVPIYSGGAKLSVVRERLTASFGTNYTGYRYTSTDNREFLDPFALVNASITYGFNAGPKHRISIVAQGSNLFNTRYEVVQSRPMPLRNFQLGLSVQFNRPVQKSHPAP